MQIGSFRAEVVMEIPTLGFPPSLVFEHADSAAMRDLESKLPAASYVATPSTLLLSHHSWLVDTGRHRILIDPCVGNLKPRRVIEAYNMLDTPWLERLAAAGATPAQVDYVFCTHLHVDHCGWNTRLENGRWVPTFPNAQYLFSRAEHDFWSAHRQDTSPVAIEVNYGVYEDSVRPVLESGQALLLDGPERLAECLTLESGAGHTPGHMIGMLDAGSEGMVFAGDALHHPLQIYRPEWNTAGCMQQEEARTTRRRLLNLCADRGWLLAAAHFRAPYAVHIERDGVSGYRVAKPASPAAA